MKALTVRQPWAWAIIHGGKDVENRLTLWRYRGLLAIHAAAPKSGDAAYMREAIQSPFFDSAVLRAKHPIIEGISPSFTGAPMFQGVVLGVVHLSGAHRRVPGQCCCASPWAMPRGVHLRLERPRALESPVAAKGRLGLWNMTEDLEAAVLAGLVPVSGDQE